MANKITDYEKVCAPANLQRAYKWIQSNPDALYKAYFRDSYTAYAAASNLALKRLSKRLNSHAYEPEHGSKIFLPKPSGVLRPITLL